MNPKFWRAATTALLLTLLPLSALAQEIACKGEDLIARYATQQPDLFTTLRQQADDLPYSKGILWKIEHEGVAPSFVFGTMHISDPRLLDLPEAAKEAFARSTTVALEIAEIVDPQKMAAAASGLLRYTAYLDGTTLDDRMTSEQIELLKPVVAEKTGMTWAVARGMRPGILMGMVSLPMCELARKRAGKPFLDMYLGQRAQAEDKGLVGLETIESQLQVLDRLPEDMLIRTIVQAAQFGALLDDVFETMIVQYEKGEIGLIWSMFHMLGPNGLVPPGSAPDYGAFQRIVVDERNVTMAQESEKLIREGGAFIAVGALHLPGEKGVLNLLAQKGFRISRP
ncbi:MAG: TraB/GumN family protein [Ahrensia sp.]|nr:TraB/GumN family protein [Ahrensia sp.]